MATLVQQATPIQASGDGTLTDVVSLSVTAGNDLILTFETRDTASSSVTSVTGSASGAFTKVAGVVGSYIYHVKAAATGTENVTVVWSAGGGNTTYYLQLSEWSGLHASPVDQSAAGNNAAPGGPPYNYTHANITPTGAGLVVACGSLSGNGNKTAGASYTKLNFTDGVRQMAEYSTSIGTSTTNAPFTADVNDSYYYAIANFLDASGGGSPAIAAFARGSNIILKGY